jgi:hypothetical protein
MKAGKEEEARERRVSRYSGGEGQETQGEASPSKKLVRTPSQNISWIWYCKPVKSSYVGGMGRKISV